MGLKFWQTEKFKSIFRFAPVRYWKFKKFKNSKNYEGRVSNYKISRIAGYKGREDWLEPTFDSAERYQFSKPKHGNQREVTELQSNPLDSEPSILLFLSCVFGPVRSNETTLVEV